MIAPRYDTVRLLGEQVVTEDGDGGLEAVVDGEEADELLLPSPSFNGGSHSRDSDIAKDILFAGTSNTRSP